MFASLDSPSRRQDVAGYLALRLLACCVAGSGTLGEVSAQVPTQPGEPTAVVRIHLRPYDDSDESIAEIERLLTLETPRRAAVNSGDTVSHVIASEYGFGAVDLPRT